MRRGRQAAGTLDAKRSAVEVLPHHRTPSINTAPRRVNASCMSASATLGLYPGKGTGNSSGVRSWSCLSAIPRAYNTLRAIYLTF